LKPVQFGGVGSPPVANQGLHIYQHGAHEATLPACPGVAGNRYNKIDVDFNFVELYKTKEQFNFIK
jgi:hypothetical protein